MTQCHVECLQLLLCARYKGTTIQFTQANLTSNVHYTNNSGKKSHKPRQLIGLTAYVFAGVAYEFCGGLRLACSTTAYSGLRPQHPQKFQYKKYKNITVQ